MDRNDIQVTVVCITYNHEEFIAQALDSFLMQKTNFKYQIFVGEDCGPDRTADIVREYAAKYPDIVIPFIRKKNMGAQRNLIDLCNHASSPYIAFCEGDDYWTDEYKLQKQFDFMEENPELRVCFAKAEIKAPEDWFLNSYYKKNDEGKLIYPECDPLYVYRGTKLKADAFISFLQAHTSTLFYRWNYDITIPDWYYDGYIGDWPLFLMQLGDGTAGFIPDIVSVYRRSDVGVYMSSNIDEHFLKTRRENVRLLSGMLNYYENYHPDNYPKVMIENRIKRDTALFIRSALKIGDWESIVKLFDDLEDGSKIALSAFLSFYFDSANMTAKYSWEGTCAVAKDRYFMTLLKPFVKAYIKIKKIYKKIKKRVLDSIVYCAKLIGYWVFAIVPKDPHLWAFSGFYKKAYMDNSKYFYEYIYENHPDIKPVWFTNSNEVFHNLQNEGKPVCKMKSFKGVLKMAQASVAVTDHYVMSDYSSIYGFNYRTKVVQLWHGVGFKAMGDGKKILSTDVKGVKLSDDILLKTEDTLKQKIIKKINFFFKAPIRELFERYFLFVCPGQERIDMLGKLWNVPETSYFMAGHPRNIDLYNYKQTTDMPEEIKILYAPTFRWNKKKEQEMISSCLDSLPLIQKCMEEIDGTFVIRLHPHTWRNYKARISHNIKDYNRIIYDTEKDIYQTLQQYSVIITDYSSLALDFAMLNKPTIFFTLDYAWFCKFEPGFNLNFEESILGPQTFSWPDTIEEVKKYIKNPQKDFDLRRTRCKYFFTPDCNGPDNSERICNEIKHRLSI